MEEFKKILEGIQKSVESLEKRVDSIQKAGEVSASGAKSPGDRSLPSPLIPVEDEVSPVVSWADRMELESEPLTSSGDEVRPVKVRDESEVVLHKAFTPLKNLTVVPYDVSLWCPIYQSPWPRSWTKSWLPSASPL